jgi:hypothetical protein
VDPVAPAAPSPRRLGAILGIVLAAFSGFAVGRWTRGASPTPPEGGGESRDDSPVVARVGDEEVRLSELDERWRQLSGAEQSFQVERGGKVSFLEELAEERLLAMEARRRGIDQEPAVRIALRACADRVLTRPLLARAVRDSAVSESEIQAWYEAHGEEWGQPLRVQVSEIVITSGPNSGPNDDTPDAATARAKADRLRAQAAAAGADFAGLARTGSEAPSAAYGGLVGWVQAGRLARTEEAAALTLQPGEISPVLEVPEGFAFFLAMAREEPTIPPLAQVRDEIVTTLLKDDEGALQRRYRVLIDELKTRVPFELHPERIESVPPAGQAPASSGPAAASGR